MFCIILDMPEKCKRGREKMSVSQYDIFLKAAELGSLTLAAETLGCTQSNASHAMAALEKEFGFSLLTRGRGGARLTPEGERILPWVRSVCESEAALRKKIREVRGLETGRLRVGSFTSVAVHWLPHILKRFQAQYPEISFELLNGDYRDVDQWLEEGKVDAAFTRLPSQLACEFLPLYEDRLMVILPAGHSKANGESFPMADIAGEPFISLLEGSDHDSIRILREAGLEPDIRFTTKDDYALIAMVESGLGISIVPELLLEGHTENIAILPLDPPAKRTIALAIPQGSRQSPATRRFADFVCEWARGYAPGKWQSFEETRGQAEA